MANVYIRPNCSRKKIVKNGDWVEYQKTKKKNDKSKKNTRQDSSAQQLEQVADFAGNSYKEYQGQGNAYSDDGGISRMIDQMISDIDQLDRFDPDRQI